MEEKRGGERRGGEEAVGGESQTQEYRNSMKRQQASLSLSLSFIATQRDLCHHSSLF